MIIAYFMPRYLFEDLSLHVVVCMHDCAVVLSRRIADGTVS